MCDGIGELGYLVIRKLGLAINLGGELKKSFSCFFYKNLYYSLSGQYTRVRVE